MKENRLIIIGASARAAAHSALRAGLSPIGCDLFADRDLAAAGEAHRVKGSDYPAAFAALFAKLPQGVPWMYTGALENHPDLIDQLAAQRPLWGNCGPGLRAVRDPLAVANVLAAAGLPHPDVRLDASKLPRDGTWLVKPLASAGGRGVMPLRARQARGRRACYFQERIEGETLAAVFVAQRSKTLLAGVTWQWTGLPGAPFAYRGSIGPLRLSPATERRVKRLGEVVAAEFGLVGFFGVDFILRDDIPWLVEVNPRYTASVEVLELATGRALLAEHQRACEGLTSRRVRLMVRQSASFSPDSGVVGKLIVVAPEPCQFPARCTWRTLHPEQPFALARLADIPRPETEFRAGDPVLTLPDSAADVPACRARLERRLQHWVRRLAEHAIVHTSRRPRLG